MYLLSIHWIDCIKQGDNKKKKKICLKDSASLLFSAFSSHTNNKERESKQTHTQGNNKNNEGKQRKNTNGNMTFMCRR
jgi:hypothetical protein